MTLEPSLEPLLASLRTQVADVVESHLREWAARVQAPPQRAGREVAAHRQSDVRSLEAQVHYLKDRLADLDRAWRASAGEGPLTMALTRLARRATATGTLESVVDALHALASGVCMFLVDGDRLTHWTSRGVAADEAHASVPAEEEWCRATVFEGSVQLLHDPALLVPFATPGVREAVVAPLEVGSVVVAVVYLEASSRDGAIDTFLPDVERVLALATPLLEAVTAEQVWRAARATPVAARREAET